MSSSIPNAPDITGIWLLRTLQMQNAETGEHVDLPAAKGVLIMHPSGRMAALITRAEQPNPDTEAEQAAAFRYMSAYSGRYRLEPPDRFITTVDIAASQLWIGTEQLRTYRFGGNTLDIVTPPARVPFTGDTPMISVLSWVRESVVS